MGSDLTPAMKAAAEALLAFTVDSDGHTDYVVDDYAMDAEAAVAAARPHIEAEVRADEGLKAARQLKGYRAAVERSVRKRIAAEILAMPRLAKLPELPPSALEWTERQMGATWAEALAADTAYDATRSAAARIAEGGEGR